MRRVGLVVTAAMGAALVFSSPAGAAPFTVDQPGDGAVGPCSPGACSLRDAVEAADLSPGPDTITFDLPAPTVIRLAGAPVGIDSPAGLTIAGPGRELLSVSGDANDNGPDVADSGVFTVGPGGAATIAGIALTDGVAASGGGLDAGPVSDVTLLDAAVRSNAAETGGGGVASQGELTVTRTAISGNATFGEGGGLLATGELSISDSTVAGNAALSGGGIALQAGTISGTTIFANRVAARGAGVGIDSIAAGETVLIARSTIAGNSGNPGSWGGGLSVTGSVDGALMLVNSTVSGNDAGGGAGASFGDSGADSLVLGATGSIVLRAATVASNRADTTGGGLYFSHYTAPPPGSPAGPIAVLDAALVGDNRAAGVAEDLDSAGAGVGGGAAAAHSLVEAPGDAPINGSPGAPNVVGSDPQLDPLDSNGGRTPTHLPQPDSPALDRAATAPGAASSDQRGEVRPVDQPAVPNGPGSDGTDIGAVELEELPPPSLGLCRGQEATIAAVPAGSVTLGTPRADVIIGTDGPDEIRGAGGPDVICAAGGRDRVAGGGGDDTLLGSAGEDRLLGRGGADVLIGGKAGDRLVGEGGPDRLFGSAGSDRLVGGAGPDGLYAHGGRDVLFGRQAVDDLDGGFGRDRLIGGPGRDRLRGGPGADAEIQ